MPDYLLAIDQGTTSTRAIVFDAALAPVATAQQEFAQIYPAPGLVEHDPEDIWATTIATVRDAMAKAGVGAGDIAALGITNQRETTVVWDRADRPADPQRHRLAGPAHRRSLRGAAGRPATSPRSRSAPGCCSILISPRPRSPGCSITSPARVTPPAPAGSLSARSTVFCSGG